jgi:hypothetical protein
VVVCHCTLGHLVADGVMVRARDLGLSVVCPPCAEASP